MSLLDICISFITLVLAFNLPSFFKALDRYDKSVLKKLFFFHFVVAITFSFMVANFGGDANLYWSFPKDYPLEDIFDTINRGSVSGIIYLINYFPSKVLELSFLTGNILYATLGYLGFIYFYLVMKRIFPDVRELTQFRILRIPIFPWIWFLPNLHFWSSGIGKDTLLFFSVAMFVYALQSLKTRIVVLVFAISISLAIRPHITLFLLIAFGIGYTLDGQLKAYQKILIFLVLIVSFASIFNYVMDFVKLESFETEVIDKYATKKSSNLNRADTGSGVDISSYPYPLKVFTFLYRPLFFDINGILAVLASFENLVLLILTWKVIRNRPLMGFRKSNYIVKGMIIYFLIGAMTFSLILGNLGIMLRQKNMFYPLFLIFALWVLYRNSLSLTQNNHESPAGN